VYIFSHFVKLSFRFKEKMVHLIHCSLQKKREKICYLTKVPIKLCFNVLVECAIILWVFYLLLLLVIIILCIEGQYFPYVRFDWPELSSAIPQCSTVVSTTFKIYKSLSRYQKFLRKQLTALFEEEKKTWKIQLIASFQCFLIAGSFCFCISNETVGEA